MTEILVGGSGLVAQRIVRTRDSGPTSRMCDRCPIHETRGLAGMDQGALQTGCAHFGWEPQKPVPLEEWVRNKYNDMGWYNMPSCYHRLACIYPHEGQTDKKSLRVSSKSFYSCLNRRRRATDAAREFVMMPYELDVVHGSLIATSFRTIWLYVTSECVSEMQKRIKPLTSILSVLSTILQRQYK